MKTLCPNLECGEFYRMKPESIGTLARCKKCSTVFRAVEYIEPEQKAVIDYENVWLPYVQAPPDTQKVRLIGLGISVVIHGLYAETTQIMKFYNPNNREIEGTVVFPLPDDGIVCGYGLDIDGKMVDGVVVPKQEARRILEAEKRKGIDPGIVEKVQGNLYRIRVYPIFAKSSRIVKVTYINDLTVQGNDAAYHLPLTHAEHIENVALKVQVIQATVKPVITGGVGNLSMNLWQERWVAKAKLGRGTPTEDLQVRLPQLPDQVVTIEKNTNDDIFFCISAKCQMPKEMTHWKPRQIMIAWDASGSRTDLSRDIAFLKKLFTYWPEVIIEVLVFRDQAEEIKSFENHNALFEYLQQIPYDGGTDLTKLDLTLNNSECEAAFLFSDGMATISHGIPQLNKKKVFTITSQSKNNSAYLKYITEKTGGIYINLLRISAPDACQTILKHKRYPNLVSPIGCKEIYLSLSQDRVTVLGKLIDDQGEIKIDGIAESLISFSIKADQADLNRIIARAWAGKKIDELEIINPKTSDESLALARRYGLVTSGASLLVLETLEQYLEYNIAPPKSLPRMLTQYNERIAWYQRDEQKSNELKIQSVLEMWRKRVLWWETDFKADLDNIRHTDATGRPSDKDFDIDDLALELNGDMLYDESQDVDIDDELIELCDDEDDEEEYIEQSDESDLVESDDEVDEVLEYNALELEDDGDLSAEVADFSDMDMEYVPKAPKKNQPQTQTSIAIMPWTPDTPYLKAMQNVETDKAYQIYLQEKKQYSNSPAFFLDCGDYLLKNEQPTLGLRVLSNLPELGIDDAALMRMYVWRLQQADELDLAIDILEKIRTQRDDEPQSHRDLALILGERWQKHHEDEDVIRAMNLLYHVVLNAWDRFPEIEIIALMELNRLIHFASQAGVDIPNTIDPRLRRLLDLDIRISMSWDADNTDVDIHIFEPTGEHAYYNYNLTNIGGLVSRDFRDGYGPEEYVLRKAIPGDYIIKAHYYGSSQQDICGTCTVIVTAFTNYGRSTENKQILTLRLDTPGDQIQVGKINIDESAFKKDDDWQNKFKNLTKGMSVTEITKKCGQPKEIKGDNEIILVYNPKPDVIIHVITSPKLVAVRQLMSGAKLDLI
ncbi:VIT domain-containing protein [Desulfococcaceae bacterium HSG9]|nr:VIT domain-containing protein [Desulfococcaceae bacterium HSG9]